MSFIWETTIALNKMDINFCKGKYNYTFDLLFFINNYIVTWSITFYSYTRDRGICIDIALSILKV